MTRDDAQLLFDWLVRNYGYPGELERPAVPTLAKRDDPKHTDNVRDVGSVTKSTRKSSAVAKAHALHGET